MGRHDVAIFALQRTSDAERVGMTTGRQRRHDERSHVGVEFIGRHDHAGPGLRDLLPPGWMQRHQKDVTAADGDVCHHSHSPSSNRVGATASRKPSGATAAAASALPARGAATGVIVSAPGAAWLSTSSVRPASSSSGLAKRSPRELPILTSLALTRPTPTRSSHCVHLGHAR